MSIHLFVPAMSVLITYPVTARLWGWLVMDQDRSATGAATELEIRTLLRAWLSPLPPPTPEMLRDLGEQ